MLRYVGCAVRAAIWETRTVSNNTLLQPNISDSYLEKSHDVCACVCLSAVILAMLTLLGAFGAIAKLCSLVV